MQIHYKTPTLVEEIEILIKIPTPCKTLMPVEEIVTLTRIAILYKTPMQVEEIQTLIKIPTPYKTLMPVENIWT